MSTDTTDIDKERVVEAERENESERGHKRQKKSNWDALPDPQSQSTETKEETASASEGLSAAQLKALAAAKEYAASLSFPVPAPRTQTLNQIPKQNSNPNVMLLRVGATPSHPNNNRTSRVYVGAINYDLKVEDILPIFEPFGPIVSIELNMDPATGRSRGFCFVEYAFYDCADNAISMLSGIEIAGRQLKIGRPADYEAPAPNVPTSNFTLNFQDAILSAHTAASKANLKLQSMGVSDTVAPTSLAPSATGANAIAVGNAPRLESDSLRREEGVSIQSSADRVHVSKMLLARTSRCIVLKNMVTKGEIDEYLEDEVRQEAGKYGELKKVKLHVIPFSIDDDPVNIFLQYNDADAASKAVQAMDKRWFGGRQVSAESYDESAMFAGDFSRA